MALGTIARRLPPPSPGAVRGIGPGIRGRGTVRGTNSSRWEQSDTRAGTLEVAIPKLRSGSYFPDWLLERRRRAEAALTSVVATCYLLGVSTRRMEKLVETPRHHPTVQVADEQDGRGPGRARRLIPDPPTRSGSVHVRGRGRADDEGPREWAGRPRPRPGRHRRQRRRPPRSARLQISSTEDGAGWLTFFRDLVARGLTRVTLVRSFGRDRRGMHHGSPLVRGASDPILEVIEIPHGAWRGSIRQVFVQAIEGPVTT
jgi:putative transposase